MATQNYFKAKNGLEAPSQSTIAVTDSNFPTVRPTLNLDFAGSESVDSRITFTRSSAATYYGADGKLKYAAQNEPRIEYDPVTGECKGLLIEEQRTNLELYTNDLDRADWTKTRLNIIPNKIIAPDGSYSGYMVIEDTSTTTSHYIYQGVSVTASATYTYSICVKAGIRSWCAIQFYGSYGAFTQGTATFDLNTGTVYTKDSSITSASIQSVGNGWYRVSATSTAAATAAGNVAFHMSLPNANTGYTGDGVSYMYIWGPQLEAGAFPTSYIPSTTTFTSRASSATYFDSTGTLRIAGTNQARYGYGYDAASGKWVSQGLLLEGAATNLAVYSESFDVSTWVKYGTTTVASNTTIAPDGNTTADTITMALSSGIYQPIAASAGTTYTWSVWLKASSAVSIAIILNTNLGDAVAQPITLGTTWQRYSITKTTATGTTSLSLQLSTSATAATFDVWGGQAEVGSVATSYIPSITSASATRAADVSSSSATTRSIEGAAIRGSYFSNALTKTNEGTALVSATNFGSASSQYNVLHVGVDNTYGYGVFREAGTNYYWAHVRTANSSYLNLNSGRVWSAGTTSKIAFAYKSGDHALAVDGSTTSTSSVTYNDIQYVNAYNIGSADGYGGQASFNGWIQKLTHYPKRISNAQLQALTA